MPIADATFTSNNKDPLDKIKDTANKLDGATLDVVFDEGNGKHAIDRSYLEMVIEDYSQVSQNPAFFNKFLQLDTNLTKELRKYKADIKSLLSSITAMDTVQQSMEPTEKPEQVQAAPDKSVQTAEPEDHQSVGGIPQ